MSESVACKTCHRAVLAHHVSEAGNCILCQPIGTAPRKLIEPATEAEWSDLGRPADSEDK